MVDLQNFTEKDLCALFDHTFLKAYASNRDMEKLCSEAKQYGFKMVAVNSCQSALCKKLLAATSVHVGAAISFPLGQTTIACKVFETEDAIRNGADEIDYVVNLTAVKNRDYGYIQKEMEEIVGVHFENIDENLLKHAMDTFYWIREIKEVRKKPSTSELIDWLNTLMLGGIDPETIRTKLPFLGVLIKKDEDIEIVKKRRIL